MSLNVSEVSAWYEGSQDKTPVIHDITFTLKSGRLCALVGVNGAGKSTLFKALMELIPFSGSITWNGQPFREARRRGLIGYVPQTEAIDASFPLLVEDVVMQGRYCHQGWFRVSSQEDRTLVAQALKRVGLLELIDRPLSQLSGGQRKRVFVARGIAQKAELLLLDEPFAGVDAKSEAIITQQLRLLAEEGRTLLVSIHDIHSARENFQDCLVINKTITAQGLASDVLRSTELLASLGLSEHGHIEEVPHA